MSNSKYNNTSVPLNIGETFIGSNEIVQPYSTINVSINATTYCLLTIKQTNDLQTYPQIDSYNIDPSTGRFIQEFAKCQYMHIEVENVDITDQTYLSVLTQFNNLPPEQENIIVSGTVAVSNIVVCDTANIAGVVSISSSALPSGASTEATLSTLNGKITACDTGAVVVSSSALPSGASTEATLSTLNGKITACNTGAVVVSSSALPSGASTEATLSTLNGKITACNTGAVVVASGAITETNSGTINSSLTSIDSKITACNTGAVVISSMPTTSSINLGSLNTTSQLISATPKSLSGLYITHRGGTQFCFIKLYNLSSATNSDTPVATFGLYKDSVIYIDTKNLNFTTAICARGTDNYIANDNTAPSGTFDIVAFVNN
jgi:predicted regulator of Ras-like GTPase activity (Roadblock/LC7/MglB family)